MNRFYKQETLPRELSVQVNEMVVDWIAETLGQADDLELTPIQEEHWQAWVEKQCGIAMDYYRNTHCTDDQFAKKYLYEGQGGRELEIIKSASDVALELRAARLAGFDVNKLNRIHVSVEEAK